MVISDWTLGTVLIVFLGTVVISDWILRTTVLGCWELWWSVIAPWELWWLVIRLARTTQSGTHWWWVEWTCSQLSYQQLRREPENRVTFRTATNIKEVLVTKGFLKSQCFQVGNTQSSFSTFPNPGLFSCSHIFVFIRFHQSRKVSEMDF